MMFAVRWGLVGPPEVTGSVLGDGEVSDSFDSCAVGDGHCALKVGLACHAESRYFPVHGALDD